MTPHGPVGPDVDLEERPLTAAPATRRVPTPSSEELDQALAADERAARPPIRWLTVAMVLLVGALALGPLVVLAIKAGLSTWYPGGDRALIELHVRDVGSHTPLLGPYSRYGWSHPGPLMYWVLAVPYRLLGATSSALLSGVVIVHIVSVAGTLAIAWRRGRLPLLVITGLLASILVRYLLPTVLDDPWNPFVTVLPLLLFLALCWTLREGDRWAAPLAVLVGSFLVQSHVGYAVIIVVAAAWVVVNGLWRQWRAHEGIPSPWRRALRTIRPGPTIAASVVAFAICWSPVVVDQVSGTHNLTQVIQYFSSDNGASAGPGFALGVATRQVAGLPVGAGDTGPPPFLGGLEPHGVDGGEVPVNVLWLLLATGLFVGVALTARRVARRASAPDDVRRRAREAVHLQTLAGLSAVAGVVSVSRITDTVFDYLMRWWSVLAMFVWLAALWSAWIVIADWRARRQPAPAKVRVVKTAGLIGALGLMLIVGVGFVLKSGETVTPEDYNRDQLAALTGPTVAATPLGGPVLVVDDGGGVTMIGDGLRLQLERADRPIVVRPDVAYKFGPTRDSSSVKPAVVVHVVYGDAIVDAARRSDLRQVALWDPLSTADRAEDFQDVVVLRNQFLAAHRMDLYDNLYSGDSLFAGYGVKGIDQALLKRVDDWRLAGRPIAVFIGPPSSA